MQIYRALSVKEPWASLIREGKKTIETRTWNTKYRGDVLIVASKRPKSFYAGNALAIAELIDCRPMTDVDVSRACCLVYDRAWSWVLQNVRPIKPFSVKGQLGLYTVQADLEIEGGSDAGTL